MDSQITETVKKIPLNSTEKLLLEQGVQSNTNKTLKVYTCNCCKNSFDLIQNNNSGKIIL